MGGVRQQFTTAAEVRLARESVRFFEELGPPLFEQVGYLFLATTEQGWRSWRRGGLQGRSASRSRRRPSYVAGLRTDDVLGAVVCRRTGSPTRPA